MPEPRKRFGQHFLQDETVIERILDAFAPARQDHVVEIGPGQGALTLPLLKRVDALEAVELDRDLVPLLQKKAEDIGKLNVHCQDVLKFDFSKIKKDGRALRVIGNLPYNISTPLIFHLLDHALIISDMMFMLQKEVAHRMAAKPSTPDYGRLSIMTQYYCEVHCLFDVPPSAFSPPPKVDSTIIKLLPFKTRPFIARDEESFAHLVKTAFNQRRKTLRNSLKEVVSEEIWKNLGIRSDLRPENLSVESFVTISNALSEKK